MRISAIAIVLLAFSGVADAQQPEPLVPVGTAVVDITPGYPLRLNGYGNRKTESEGVESRLKARALAIGGDGAEGPAVLVAVDNCGVPARVTDEVAARLARRNGVKRERFVVSSSHTHAGPCLSNGIPFIFGAKLPSEQQARIDRYTGELTDAIEKVALEALAARAPGSLAWGRGRVDFAANRRVLKDGRWTGFGVNPEGPTDPSVPVLRVADVEGKTRAILVGYACHCTTVGGDFNKVCADWAGYASDDLERANPGATALVIIGCGADANPEPRRGVDDARRHGASLAREVGRVLAGPLTPVPGRITAAFRRIELPLGPLPTRADFVERTKRGGAEAYFARTMLEQLDRGEPLARAVPYPVQTWCFGDSLAIVFLGGEVVVDYALRLNRECDPSRLWVVAYSNDVPCYVASKRVIAEGGYEVDGSMTYYGKPTRLAPEAEDANIDAVRDLLPATFRKAAR